MRKFIIAALAAASLVTAASAARADYWIAGTYVVTPPVPTYTVVTTYGRPTYSVPTCYVNVYGQLFCS